MKKWFMFLMVVLIMQAVPLLASEQFLWKPASENDGKLVVLFPSKIRLENVQSITVNGTAKPSITQQTGANGDRIHARFGQSGKSFGKDIEVKLIAKNGDEYVWKIPDGSKRFEKITSIKGGGAIGGNSTLDDLIKAEAPQGAVRLTNADQGTKEYTVKAAGELAVDALLMTYGPAEMWIKDADGKELLSWKRSNDRDPAKLIVNGETIDASNVEVKPGDFTPSPQKVKIPVTAGQVISVHLSGEFGAGESYLVINE